MAWVLLLASAAAVAGTGIITTVLILSHLENWPGMSWWVLWPQVLAASTLTVVSLALRTLRWVFLLRRAETRIPIRDAYIGYLAGFSLLFAPLFLGEIALRALVPPDEFGREGQCDSSRTCMNSASTRNCLCSSSGPNSMASYSGLSGFRRMARCRHWSSPAGPFSLV